MRDHIRDIYKKIGEQSKKNFFFNVFSAKKTRNKNRNFSVKSYYCLVVYEKEKFRKQNDIIFLINIFLKDLELLCFEMGGVRVKFEKKK